MSLIDNVKNVLKGKPKTQEQLIQEKEEQDRRQLEADEYRRQRHEANMRETKIRATREAKTQVAVPAPQSMGKKAWNYLTTAPDSNPFASDFGGGSSKDRGHAESSPFASDFGGGSSRGRGHAESNPFASDMGGGGFGESSKKHTHKKKHSKKNGGVTVVIKR